MAQIVTITNPLTGQPAQVDQLEHTAQEIDDAIARALPGGAIDIASQNKATILKDSLDLYVSTSGSDTTGDGSESNPFRTIQHAVDMIPPVLNGKRVIINVAAGTYDEDVVIQGKCASRGERPIYINGASSKDDAVNYKVRSITASGTGMGSIQIRGFKFLGYEGIWDIGSYGDACFYIQNCILDSATKYGVYLADKPYSHACIANSTISNKTTTAFLSELGNILLVRNCTGSDNAVVFTSGLGSGFGGMIFNGGGNSISGTTAEVKYYGGQIFK